jgi:hypothetical protein
VDSANEHLIVTGFKQDDGPPCTQLQIPFIRAYSYTGEVAWSAYDWNHTEVGSVDECADSRGIAVSMGRDGKLYYAGESHGGNTVHRRDPSDYQTMTTKVVKSDSYNDAYNMNGAAPVLFFARFDAATGELEGAQVGVTRLSTGKGNALRPRSITADEKGNMLVGGDAACCIEAAEDKTLNGSTPAFGSYLGGAFVLIVPPDFSSRLLWTSLVGPSGGGASVTGVAAGGGRMAATVRQAYEDKPTTTEPLFTFEALQAGPGGGMSDGLLSVWRAP